MFEKLYLPETCLTCLIGRQNQCRQDDQNHHVLTDNVFLLYPSGVKRKEK